MQMILKAEVKAIKEKYGMKNVFISKQTGIRPDYLSRWLNKENINFGIENYEKMKAFVNQYK